MRICTFQVPMSSDILENVDTVARCLRIAASEQADLAVLPEMMLVGYDQHLHEFFRYPARIFEKERKTECNKSVAGYASLRPNGRD